MGSILFADTQTPRTHTHTDARTHARMHARMHTHHADTQTTPHTHARMHAHTHTSCRHANHTAHACTHTHQYYDCCFQGRLVFEVSGVYPAPSFFSVHAMEGGSGRITVSRSLLSDSLQLSTYKVCCLSLITVCHSYINCNHVMIMYLKLI